MRIKMQHILNDEEFKQFMELKQKYNKLVKKYNEVVFIIDNNLSEKYYYDDEVEIE